MAQRFGGKFSPSGANPQQPEAARPMVQPSSKQQRRASILGLSALMFFLPAFQGDPRRLILCLIAGSLILLGAWMTREGIKAHEVYDARRISRRPALPRKALGAVLVAGALFAGSMARQDGLVFPILIALAGAALHLTAFGLDPLRDKGAEGLDPFQTDRVARAVTEAEGHLTAMKDAILRAQDHALEGRIDRFAQTARGLFRSVESDPGDLTAARKFLSVYLQGARDATVKFADLYAHNRSSTARTEYEALLTDLETTFAARTTALLANGHTDLDVEISVLRDRLKLET